MIVEINIFYIDTDSRFCSHENHKKIENTRAKYN